MDFHWMYGIFLLSLGFLIMSGVGMIVSEEMKNRLIFIALFAVSLFFTGVAAPL